MLTNIATHFTWPVSSEGHYWVRAYPVRDDWALGARSFPVLVPKGVRATAKNPSASSADRMPLEDSTGLFHELGGVDPTPEGIRSFADRYGLLTKGSLFVPADLDVKLPRPPLSYSPRNLWQKLHTYEGGKALQAAQEWERLGAVFGDPLHEWEGKIGRMKLLIELWEAVRDNNNAALRRKVKLELNGDDQVVRLIAPDGSRSLGYRNPVHDWQFKTLRDGARYALANLLKDDLQNELAVDLRMMDFQKPLRLLIDTHSLQAAIWLQFTMAVSDDKNFRNCEVCGKPFEISPPVGRRHKTLCSPACKATAHRRRRSQALELAKNRKTVKQIAQAVGSQPSTVKTWLASKGTKVPRR